jgi:hypothetical protein
MDLGLKLPHGQAIVRNLQLWVAGTGPQFGGTDYAGNREGITNAARVAGSSTGLTVFGGMRCTPCGIIAAAAAIPPCCKNFRRVIDNSEPFVETAYYIPPSRLRW